MATGTTLAAVGEYAIPPPLAADADVMNSGHSPDHAQGLLDLTNADGTGGIREVLENSRQVWQQRQQYKNSQQRHKACRNSSMFLLHLINKVDRQNLDTLRHKTRKAAQLGRNTVLRIGADVNMRIA